MMIVILGPCGSGKTTLAKEAASKLKAKHIDLDTLFVDYKNSTSKKVSHFELNEVESEIKSLMKKHEKNGIVFEGIYIIESLLKKADLVIILNPGLDKCLFRQWRRYLNDKEQRRQYGFINNILLSWIIVNQHKTHKDAYKFGEFNYPSFRSYKKTYSKYRNKSFLIYK